MAIAQTENKSKNSYIELCRFLAAVIMMLHHTAYLDGKTVIAPGGWLFVEFFFILSGYFMTKHFTSCEEDCGDPGKSALLYTFNKVRRVFPYAAVGICIDAVALTVSGVIPMQQLIGLLAELPAHFLFLVGFGFTKYDINAPLWYVSDLMLAMPVLILLQLRLKRLYRSIGAWAIPLLLYVVIFTVNGNIQYWGENWTLNCLMRAFAGLCLGSLAFYASEYLKRLELTWSMRKYLTALELVLLFGLVFLSFAYGCLDYAMMCVLFSLVMLIIAFSGQDVISEKIPCWVNALGRLGLPLYCLHRPIFDLLRWACDDKPFVLRLCLGLSLSFVVSAGILLLVSKTFFQRRTELN